jgi:hypothetical protein
MSASLIGRLGQAAESEEKREPASDIDTGVQPMPALGASPVLLRFPKQKCLRRILRDGWKKPVKLP